MPDPDYLRVDYTNWEFLSRPEYNWSDRTVHGACFSQEKPDTIVFSPSTRNVRFVWCNLDNVSLPPGSVTEHCSQRRFAIQNDLRDWEIDEDGNPVRVLNEKHWNLQGISVDPEDIPVQPIVLARGELLEDKLPRRRG